MFSKPVHTHRAEPATPIWVKVIKRAALVLILLLALILAASAIWAHSMGNKFNEERTVIDMDGQKGNAQPDMSEFLDEDDGTTTVSRDDEPDVKPAEGPLNILLMGSDVRTDGSIEGARSDTLMVAHIPEDRSSVQIMSIPRDLWVPIPGHGKERINSAFDTGGPGLTRDTVENLLGIRINHVVVVDFDGFAELTTALGGVTVDNPQEFTTTYKPKYTFKKGKITLKGDAALQYVRERKAFPDSDFTRVQNQQRVVRAVLSKMLSAGTLTRPDRIENVLDTALPYLSVDEDLTAERIVQYGLQSRSLRADDISSFTIPTGDPFTTEAGAEVLGVDDGDLKQVRDAFNDDTLGDYVDDQAS